MKKLASALTILALIIKINTKIKYQINKILYLQNVLYIQYLI